MPRALINSYVASTLLLGKDASYTNQLLGKKKHPFSEGLQGADFYYYP
jgi:hypothetical protein